MGCNWALVLVLWRQVLRRREEELGLCPKQVADLAGVDYRTVLRHIRTGHLRAKRIGPKLWDISPLEFYRYTGRKPPAPHTKTRQN